MTRAKRDWRKYDHYTPKPSPWVPFEHVLNGQTCPVQPEGGPWSVTIETATIDEAPRYRWVCSCGSVSGPVALKDPDPTVILWPRHLVRAHGIDGKAHAEVVIRLGALTGVKVGKKSFDGGTFISYPNGRGEYSGRQFGRFTSKER